MVHWDLFVDEVKDGGKLLSLGVLAFEAGVTEGMHVLLQKAKSKEEGTGRVGEIHWADLKDKEGRVARDWIYHFLSGPMMFFAVVHVPGAESKQAALERTISAFERDPRIRGGLSRSATTLHIDIDLADDSDLLRKLRREFGLLRAFKWESRGSLLLQLSDLLLGIARADASGSLDGIAEPSKGEERKIAVLNYARDEARAFFWRNKLNSVIEIGTDGAMRWLLIGNGALPSGSKVGEGVDVFQ